MTEPEHFVPLVPVQPEPLPSTGLVPVQASTVRRPSRLVRVGIVTGTAALVLVGAVAAMGASPAPSGSTTTPTTPAASGAPNAGGPGPGQGHMRGDMGGFGRGFGDIKITQVDGSNVSLATDDGWTRTITATSTTEITKNGATIKITDLAVGDEIHFGQAKAADGTYSITKIVVVMPSVGGEVTAKTADTITVTQRDGTSATIHVDSGTTFTVQGVASPTLADITVGMHVRAEGTKNSDGSLAASSVQGGTGGTGGHGPDGGGPRGHGPGDRDGMRGVPPGAPPSASPTP